VSESTRQKLQLLLGLWYAAGAVLVIALLAKGDDGALIERTGASALAIIVLGFPLMAGLRLAERPERAGLVGALTALVSIATFFLVGVEIWSEDSLQQYERTIAMVVISLLLGMISLLLEGKRDEDDGPVRLVRGIAVLALLALGFLTVLAICDVDVNPRLPSLAAALFIIPTLSLPVLRLLSSER
jgi:hypothetical protein